MNRLITVGTLLLACGAVSAQPGTGGTISHNNATYTQGDVPTLLTSSGPNGEFRVGGAGNPNHYFQSWWWLRQDGVHTREIALNSASNASWSGNQGIIDYASPTMPIVQTYQVIGFGSGGALIESLTITNTTGQAISASIFHYLDLDLNATSTGDSAVLNGPNSIRVFDGPWIANYEGSGTYAVGPFPDVRGLLTNTGIDNFTNTGLPFGPADWTGGWQWSFSLQPSESITLTASVTIIPAPGALALLGACGLLTRRRRR
jgi:hypothetical protein